MQSTFHAATIEGNLTPQKFTAQPVGVPREQAVSMLHLLHLHKEGKRPTKTNPGHSVITLIKDWEIWRIHSREAR
jgi:hypothetical protein